MIMWYAKKSKPPAAIIYPTIDCISITETKSVCSCSMNMSVRNDRIWWYKHLRHTTIGNMTTTGKFDTTDLILIIRWVKTYPFNYLISNRPDKHMQPHILQKWQPIELTPSKIHIESLLVFLVKKHTLFFHLGYVKRICIMLFDIPKQECWNGIMISAWWNNWPTNVFGQLGPSCS